MNSIIEEISKLRKGAPIVVDYKNSNRYRVVTVEENGSRTAYCFSAPIYNTKTRKAIDLRFYRDGTTVFFTGSDAQIEISDNIKLTNSEGSCNISLNSKYSSISDTEIMFSNERIYPTTNGIAIRSTIDNNNSYTFTIELNKPFLKIRANDKYVAVMSERFRPFIVFSSIGTLDENGTIISPAKVSYQKITERKYTITVTPCSLVGKSVIIEANLYESKLFQDTTVESNKPKINNAFGGIGFIGCTKEFGEQWLYSKLDFAKISDLNDKKILYAVLHIPKLNSTAAELKLSKVAARFCSFGSNWYNKISESSLSNYPLINEHYIDVDLSPIITDRQHRLCRSDGFILKSKNRNSGFSVIATGDNYLSPQILEINYR
jgi:hypothetical protein